MKQHLLHGIKIDVPFLYTKYLQISNLVNVKMPAAKYRNKRTL